MNNAILKADGYTYNSTLYNQEFEDILEGVIMCYNLIKSKKKSLENNENQIRDVMVNEYLMNNNVRKNIGIRDYLFYRELPTIDNSGRVDILVVLQKSTFEDTNAYYIIECKRLDGKNKLNKEYISNGIKRFTNEKKYPMHKNTAGMIGFVVSKMNINENVKSINQLLQNTFTQINTEKGLTKKQITPDFEYSYYSDHKVGVSTKTIYHLMFEFSNSVSSRREMIIIKPQI